MAPMPWGRDALRSNLRALRRPDLMLCSSLTDVSQTYYVQRRSARRNLTKRAFHSFLTLVPTHKESRSKNRCLLIIELWRLMNPLAFRGRSRTLGPYTDCIAPPSPRADVDVAESVKPAGTCHPGTPVPVYSCDGREGMILTLASDVSSGNSFTVLGKSTGRPVSALIRRLRLSMPTTCANTSVSHIA
ncbi:hypothetical protein EV356DRAFT_276631 [Viridothelium virens]|uniref:Uncharacterized protein n=1 Tax=Viridothelium virens TaxID=1048519 RepID=A0A6A6H1F8_VIRVR|nr:hypothetical protein EV356DRAFT_276631 [Viridothelium virens]